MIGGLIQNCLRWLKVVKCEFHTCMKPIMDGEEAVEVRSGIWRERKGVELNPRSPDLSFFHKICFLMMLAEK